MPNGVLDSMLIALGLDSSKFKEGLASSESLSKQTGKNLANNLTAPAQTVLGQLKTLFAPLAGGLAFGAMVSQFTSQADAIGKLAGQLGLDVEMLQAWGGAAKRAGGSAQAFNATIRGLNSQINVLASTGQGRAKVIFEQLGIAVKDAGGKTRDTFVVLSELAEKAEGMGKAEFAGLAQRLGIDQGTIMLLQSGRKSIDDLIARQRMLGNYTQEDAEIAAQFNDIMDDLAQIVQSVAAVIMRIVVPALSWLTDKIVNVISFFRQHQAFVGAAIGIIAAAVTAKMIPAIIKLLPLLNAVMIRIAAILVPLLPVIAAITALAIAADELWAFISGGESVLEKIMLKFGMTRETIEGIRNTLRGAVEFFWDLWDAVTGEGVDKDSAIERLKASWEATKEWFKGLIDDLLNAFGNMFSRIKDWLKNLLPDWVKRLIGGEEQKTEKTPQQVAQMQQSIARRPDETIEEYAARVGVLEDDGIEAMESGNAAEETRPRDAGKPAWIDAVLSRVDAFSEDLQDWADGALLDIPATPADMPGVVNNTSNVQTTTNNRTDVRVGNVTVQTQATDAPAIARSIGPAIQKNAFGSLVSASQTGTVQK